jgi:hypothetical protein
MLSFAKIVRLQTRSNQQDSKTESVVQAVVIGQPAKGDAPRRESHDR